MAILTVTCSKAEASGWRVYLNVIKKGKTKLIKSKWFPREKDAKSHATAWKRMYL